MSSCSKVRLSKKSKRDLPTRSKKKQFLSCFSQNSTCVISDNIEPLFVWTVLYGLCSIIGPIGSTLVHPTSRWMHWAIHSLMPFCSVCRQFFGFFRSCLTMSIQFFLGRPGFLLYPLNSRYIVWWSIFQLEDATFINVSLIDKLDPTIPFCSLSWSLSVLPAPRKTQSFNESHAYGTQIHT